MNLFVQNVHLYMFFKYVHIHIFYAYTHAYKRACIYIYDINQRVLCNIDEYTLVLCYLFKQPYK